MPGNVIILMESYKPNLIQDSSGKWIENNTLPGNGYKPYFEKSTEIWTTDPKSGSGSPRTLVELRIGKPHQKSSKMNVLSADGHVALVDPFKDFFRDSNDQKTVKDYLWYAGYKPPGQGGYPNWKRGAPGI